MFHPFLATKWFTLVTYLRRERHKKLRAKCCTKIFIVTRLK